MVYLLAKATNFLLYDDDCYCYTAFLFRLCRFVESFQPDCMDKVQQNERERERRKEKAVKKNIQKNSIATPRKTQAHTNTQNPQENSISKSIIQLNTQHTQTVFNIQKHGYFCVESVPFCFLLTFTENSYDCRILYTYTKIYTHTERREREITFYCFNLNRDNSKVSIFIPWFSVCVYLCILSLCVSIKTNAFVFFRSIFSSSDYYDLIHPF